MRFRIVLTIMSMLALLAGAAIGERFISIEARPSVDLTQVKKIVDLGSGYGVHRVCDAETGHLLYVYIGFEKGGLVIVPGGCR